MIITPVQLTLAMMILDVLMPKLPATITVNVQLTLVTLYKDASILQSLVMITMPALMTAVILPLDVPL
jgi:hypothetical protein